MNKTKKFFKYRPLNWRRCFYGYKFSNEVKICNMDWYKSFGYHKGDNIICVHTKEQIKSAWEKAQEETDKYFGENFNAGLEAVAILKEGKYRSEFIYKPTRYEMPLTEEIK